MDSAFNYLIADEHEILLTRILNCSGENLEEKQGTLGQYIISTASYEVLLDLYN